MMSLKVIFFPLQKGWMAFLFFFLLPFLSASSTCQLEEILFFNLTLSLRRKRSLKNHIFSSLPRRHDKRSNNGRQFERQMLPARVMWEQRSNNKAFFFFFFFRLTHEMSQDLLPPDTLKTMKQNTPFFTSKRKKKKKKYSVPQETH